MADEVDGLLAQSARHFHHLVRHQEQDVKGKQYTVGCYCYAVVSGNVIDRSSRDNQDRSSTDDSRSQEPTRGLASSVTSATARTGSCRSEIPGGGDVLPWHRNE